MVRTYLYFPGSKKRRGGNYEDFAHSTALPLNDSYAVDENNAYIVPLWAHQANVPIPVNSNAANLLKKYNAPGQIVPVPNVSRSTVKQEKKENPGWFTGVNFNSLAELISRVILNYMDAKNRQNESWWQTLARVPAQGLRNYTKYDGGFGEPVSKGTFLNMATPVISRIANSFLPGWGSLLTSGLRFVGNQIFGSGHTKKVKSGKRYKIVYNNKTRNLLKGDISRDVKQASENTLKDRVQDTRWRKLISSAFASAIKTVAPAIGSGRLVLGRKLNLKKIKKMGGSASDKEYMAWVRSFIGKKKKGSGKGKGLKARNSVPTQTGISYYGAGKKSRSKRGHNKKSKKSGGKFIIYRNHGVHYIKGKKKGSGLKLKSTKKKVKKHQKRGGNVVSSGIYKKGTPGNYSGDPKEWYPN